MKTTISTTMLAKLRRKVEYSYTVRNRLAKARIRIRELEKELEAERKLNKALSKLSYAKSQKPEILQEVKAAMGRRAA